METKESDRYLCPLCGRKMLTVAETPYEIPKFGKILLINITCQHCRFHKSDVLALEYRGPTKCQFKVKSPKDLYAKVVRSSTGRIYIPEIGVEIFPGPAAQGFITNIEGVLARVKEIVEQLLRDSETEEERQAALKALDWLEKAMSGIVQFTLILEDPYGVSAIIPEE